jgi:hypothetical protein
MLSKSITLFIISLGLIYVSSYFSSKNQSIDSAITQVEISYMNTGDKGNINLTNMDFETRMKERNERIKILESRKFPYWTKYISTALLLVAGLLFGNALSLIRRYWMNRKKA